MFVTISLLFLAIVLSGFFSGAEVALVGVSKLKAQQLVDKKKRHAETLLYLKNHPSKMLIAILIGNNIVNIGGSALATKLALDLFPNSGVGIATGVMTLLILTFGEITPKTYCAKNTVKIALAIAPYVKILMIILSPFVWFFYKLSKATNSSSYVIDEPLVTEEEVQDMVTIGEREGQIKPDERDMIRRIFRFDDTEVHEVMTPRTDMFALDMNMTLADAVHLIIDQEFSRVPIYDKSLDKIKGVVLVRDLLNALSSGKTMKRLKDIASKPLFVPEYKKIDKLLKELQDKKMHLAIVVNEHGGVEGLITIEDLLEEIVGDIFDESDEIEHLIRPRGENTWLVLGKTPIDDLNEELDLNLSEDENFNTVAGLIHHQLGRIPDKGAVCKIKDENISLTVKKVEGPTILEVLLQKH